AINVGSVGVIPRLAMLRGDALHLLGQHDAAEAELLQALEIATVYGAKPLLWRIHADLGRLYQEQSRLEKAQQHVRSVGALIDELGAQLPETLRDSFYQHSLTYLPEAYSHSTPTVRSMLTPREREIVILVSLGKTNRQIGEQLVISERTVETHV